MNDESRPSLGQLYAESDLRSRVPQNAPDNQGSLGSLYAAWMGEDSGYLPMPDPQVIQARKDAIARGEDPDALPRATPQETEQPAGIDLPDPGLLDAHLADVTSVHRQLQQRLSDLSG